MPSLDGCTRLRLRLGLTSLLGLRTRCRLDLGLTLSLCTGSLLGLGLTLPLRTRLFLGLGLTLLLRGYSPSSAGASLDGDPQRAICS